MQINLPDTKLLKSILFTILVVSSPFIFSQTPDHIEEEYKLFWADEFDGESLDTSKWGYRGAGSKRVHGTVRKENSYLDKKGHLVIEVTKEDSSYFIGQIGTQNKMMTNYGYFECRAKMNKQLGPGVAFWLQSPLLGTVMDNPGKAGAEIDIMEYRTRDGIDKVYHTVHWNGYGENHKRVGTIKKVKGLHEGFHTFGLEWTDDKYIFYVDGKKTWATRKGISNIEQYIILSADLNGWGGDFSKSTFPDQVVYDYVRVYKSKGIE